MPPPLRGLRHEATLSVTVPHGWEITDCYVTIDKELEIYREDGVLLDPVFSTWFADKTKPAYKALRWNTPLDKDYKITIGENSNSETVLVGMINHGEMPHVHGEYVPFTTFDYCLFSNSPTKIQLASLGLREISVALHWKRNGKRMPVKKFDGYIYAEVSGGIPKIRIGAGNYSKDKTIPAPLPKKAEDKAVR